MTRKQSGRRQEETGASVVLETHPRDEDHCKAGPAFRRVLFTEEDPRMLPLSDLDVDAVNRIDRVEDYCGLMRKEPVSSGDYLVSQYKARMQSGGDRVDKRVIKELMRT